MTDAYVQYILNSSTLPDWTLIGARTNITGKGGDSGSPYFQTVSSSSSVAIGVFSGYSSTTTTFARIYDVLPGRGWNVVR